tara:strand:- start:8722 stop:9177 length:456 start_codon:yes stop_codon:yes gene_type:complete
MAEFISSLITNYGLFGLFITAFISYSIFPIPPIEVFIVLALNFFNPYTVFFTALLGATFGSILNYFIGIKGIRRFINKSSKKEKKAERLFDKWGPISIVLFGWLPIIGNPLIIIAGTLKMNFWKLLVYSILGKIWYLILVIWFGSFLNSLF